MSIKIGHTVFAFSNTLGHNIHAHKNVLNSYISILNYDAFAYVKKMSYACKNKNIMWSLLFCSVVCNMFLFFGIISMS